MASNPRRSNGSRRTALRKRMAAKGLPCALCGGTIDYSLPAGDPMSFELDEIIPVSRYQEGGYVTPEQCALDPENHQPTHRICNQRKGNGQRKVTAPFAPFAPLVTSRDWVAFAQTKE